MARGYLAETVPRSIQVHEEKEKKDKWLSKRFVGIDGEGMDTPDGRHLYTYLAAVDEDGTIIADAYSDDGLTHDECCEVLLAIPRNCLVFAYMFSYDLTKIIEQMPDEDKYRLMRPETRRIVFCKDCKRGWTIDSEVCPHCGGPRGREGSDPVHYNGRAYDYFNGSFTLRGNWDPFDKKWMRGVKVWDSIRFFGCAFVQAIADWKVGTKEQIARIEDMKKKRGSFDKESPEDIRKYCQEECELLAQMMRKVVEGHVLAGWKLKAFYGAGSTGKAMLEANEVKTYRGRKHTDYPEELQKAVMSSFFGGRFENSMVGTIEVPLWSKDIASAYPYAMTSLPCLACGEWRHVQGAELLKEIRKAPLAAIRFMVKGLPDDVREKMAWGPLPFRDEMGSICYPVNFTGWAWKPEVMSAVLGWPRLITVFEAWVYDKKCSHDPFAFMPDVYRRRVAIGKEGPGLVLKLGANAGYGVTAQSIGDDPPFQQWAWAGNITSSCRAQALDCIRFAKDPWSILTVATDGIVATHDFRVPMPRNTGTVGCRAPASAKFPEGEIKQPLGGWESEEIPEGMFVAKPGMYFRLATDMKKLRARGVGRKELFDSKDAIIQAFDDWDRKDTKYCFKIQSRRFWGVKSTIYARSRCFECQCSWPGVPEQKCPRCGRLGDHFEAKRQTMVTDETRKDEGRVDVYGTWGARTIEIRFNPHPKRERRVGAGRWSRLFVRDVGGEESLPYLGEKTPEAQMLFADAQMLEEQPDVVEDGFLDELPE